MAKYEITINRDLCACCACASGRCPPHARTLSRLLNEHSSNGIIGDEYIDEAQKVAESCPNEAIKIKRIS